MIILALPLSANFCVSSCNSKNLPDYYMNDNFRSYVDFPKGSYWIYEETLTGGKSDSMYLYEREYSTDRSGKYVDYHYDWINLKFFRSYYRDTLKGTSKLDVFIKKGYYYAENPSIYSDVNVQYFTEIGGINFSYDYPGSKILYKDSLESYKVIGVDYKQVKVFENLIKRYEKQPKIIYYAKNVGVIKKELFNGEVWELKKYFINK